MTSQNDLIDELTERTGVDPYKLKRLSKNELEQLVAAYKEDEETFNEPRIANAYGALLQIK